MIKEITFGAGCFWCIEACFNEVSGIHKVIPGYSGGAKETANYDTVCKGGTGHSEVARIIYDQDIISFEKLLKLFWFVHDPTQINRQGNDIGYHYRSVIFFHDEEQQKIAEAYKEKLTKEMVWEDPIVTAIEPLRNFYKAEDYHHNFLENNPENMYCRSQVRPKVEKFKRVFSDLMK